MAATAAFRRSQVESSKSAGRTGAAVLREEKEEKRLREEKSEVSKSIESKAKTIFVYVAPGSLLPASFEYCARESR